MELREYRTIAGPAQDEFTERRSRFIGRIAPVVTEQEAQAYIDSIKTQHWDATHNVYAYILRDGAQRYSDDGEPQGTAGVPVLEVLRKEQLFDVVAVVTRYFGGILLGAGGLVRAYSHGVKLAVDAATPKIMSECTELLLEFGYDFYGKFQHMLQHYRFVLLGSDFGAQVQIRLLLRDCDLETLQKEITELSSGTVIPKETGKRWDEIPE